MLNQDEPRFWSWNIGKRAPIVRSWYGLKWSHTNFRNHLADYKAHLKYESCEVDVKIWMWYVVANDDHKYCQCILLYVDDVLVVSEHPNDFFIKIGKYF